MSRPFAVEVRDALNLSLRDRRISAAFVSEQLPEWQMIWESAAKIDAEMNAAAAASAIRQPSKLCESGAA